MGGVFGTHLRPKGGFRRLHPPYGYYGYYGYDGHSDGGSCHVELPALEDSRRVILLYGGHGSATTDIDN